MRALRSHAVCFAGKRFAAGAPMILGDRRVGVHKCTDYIYRRRHLIGALSPNGRTRATAGPLLSLADTTSMRAAFYFVNRYTCDGQWEVLEDRTMVTAGFNDVTVVKPIYQGDLLQLEARVVHCRAASLGVYCSVSRQAYDCPVPERVAECYVTAVVLNPSTMKPKSGMIPAVEIEEEEDKGRSAFYSHVIGGRKRKEAGVGGPLTPAECELSTAKPINVSIQESHTLSDWWYVIDALNGNNVVFGGAILGQMERAALHCGRVFCGSPFLFTIGVFDLAFYAPMKLTDMGRSRARVVGVHHSRLIVEVTVERELDGVRERTNRGLFLLLQTDQEDVPTCIEKGLDLSSATQEELRTHQKALHLVERERV